MSNYIMDNKTRLSQRHYLLVANQAGYWFNASQNRIRHFQANFGDSFCVVLYRDGTEDDAYVLPFRGIKMLFSNENLVSGSKGTIRWMGSIDSDEYLNMRTEYGFSTSVSVRGFHNAFQHIIEM